LQQRTDNDDKTASTRLHPLNPSSVTKRAWRSI
jgi:hypothetical protein